ncbi:MAG: hypothetical protein IPO16_15000 [Saprospiraceae bacterium]|nr:hypothetical protein [Saprospiraceae bacterium]
MPYTKELIDEVKALYPTSAEMIKHAENGSVWLGRYLDDSCDTGIHIDKILSASSLEDLQKEARLEKRKVKLYHKWCKQDPRKSGN